MDNYNGWTNRETWCVHLWITNDEVFYAELRGRSPTEIEESFKEIETMVIDGAASEETATMILDIGSLWRVNWKEVSAALTD